MPNDPTNAPAAAPAPADAAQAPADAVSAFTAPVHPASAAIPPDGEPTNAQLADSSLKRLIPTSAASLVPPPPFKGLLALLYMVKYDRRYNYAFHIDSPNVCDLFDCGPGTKYWEFIDKINGQHGNSAKKELLKKAISQTGEHGFLDEFVAEIVDEVPDPPPFW